MTNSRKSNPTRRKRGNPTGYTVVTNRSYGSIQGARAFAAQFPAADYIRQISKVGGSSWKVLILDKSKPLKDNPSIPKGRWVKAKAVKFNRNGSVSIKK